MKAFAFLMFLVVLAPILTSSAQSDSSRIAALNGHYFLVVWGSQGQDNDVVDSHTFASFYRGDDLAKGVVKPATISWLPATGVVQLFGSEKGRNFSLAQTLRMACRSGREVRSWGPYEIKPALFRRALQRIRLLQSGRIQYSMIDIPSGTLNCIDAAGDITPAPLDSGISWGFAASAEVVQHLSPYFKRGGRTVEALAISIPKACSRPEMVRH